MLLIKPPCRQLLAVYISVLFPAKHFSYRQTTQYAISHAPTLQFSMGRTCGTFIFFACAFSPIYLHALTAAKFSFRTAIIVSALCAAALIIRFTTTSSREGSSLGAGTGKSATQHARAAAKKAKKKEKKERVERCSVLTTCTFQRRAAEAA